ncbi:MAG: CPA1 family monovalent cation:H+ antiporter [Limisphaerales bacterium]|jgi:CPA1 family monovalent cation:H+ antiporter
MFASFSVLIAIAAIFSWVNTKWLKLPATIGLMILALVMAGLTISMQHVSKPVYDLFCNLVINSDFHTLVMDVMLSFLLFAGAMHVDIRKLATEKTAVLVFATVGTLISTVIIGALLFGAAQLLNVEMSFMTGLLFGALISPTDPIAVLSLLQKAGIAEKLQLRIEGESLFNDGVGVVVFTVILALSGYGHEGQGEELNIGMLFLKEGVGGLVYGLGIGWLGFQMMRTVITDPKTSVLISLAIASGGYGLAAELGLSGPLAMVAAGLYVGNRISSADFDQNTYRFLDIFWEMLDDTLNAVLFVFIGLVVHTIVWNSQWILLSGFAVIIVLLARYIATGALINMFAHHEHKKSSTVAILTWGGLRGGISVALALSLPDQIRDLLLAITYPVVIFSIIVQGLSIGWVVKKLG